MNACPICNITHAPYDRDVTKIGQSEFHNNCLRRKRREAETSGQDLHFVWQGEVCTDVKLVARTGQLVLAFEQRVH